MRAPPIHWLPLEAFRLASDSNISQAPMVYLRIMFSPSCRTIGASCGLPLRGD